LASCANSWSRGDPIMHEYRPVTRPVSVDIMNKKAMGKYHPLERYLRENKARVVAMTFAHVEQVIGSRLPDSATRYRAWWGNDRSHAQAQAWLNAGRIVEEIDSDKRVVVFSRR
jgi:hypothetical protein